MSIRASVKKSYLHLKESIAKVGVSTSANLEFHRDLRFMPPPKMAQLGTVYGSWTIPDNFLTEDSICYFAGAGEDLSFDAMVSSTYHSKIYIIDPTPRAYTHFKELEKALVNSQSFPINNNPDEIYQLSLQDFRNFHFVPKGLWRDRGNVRFYAPKDSKHVSHSLVNLQKTDSYLEVEVLTVKDLMDELGHNQVDILKIDIEGAEYAVIESIVKQKPQIKVLCIEFDEVHQPLDKHFMKRINEAALSLQKNGFVPVHSTQNLNLTMIEKTCYESLFSKSSI